jgi:peptidoglycan/xylan/chitin deacetylase (PgdA/CDA1 family)
MYHYLSEPPANANEVRRDLSVSPAQFESHLAYLRQEGYESITMQQLAYALSGQETLPAKPIVITFDDGYLDNYQNAFPLLQKYGYTGVFYIFTYPLDYDDPNYLSWEMVQEMHRAGMEFGSHGYRHWELAGRDVDFLVYEILGSKEAIEAHIGEPVRFFSYPVGRYDNLAMQVVQSANFWNAVTTEFDIEQSFADRYALPRLRVHGYDTVDKLALKLNAF